MKTCRILSALVSGLALLATAGCEQDPSGGTGDGGLADATALDQGVGGDGTPGPDAASDAGPVPDAAPPVAVDWVALPGGTFTLGSDDPAAQALRALPAHEVTLAPFALGRTEVTVAEYRACREAGACPPARAVTLDYPACDLDPARDDHPVVCLILDEARAFATWVGGRLPSEAEWEFSARGADADQLYPWGMEAPDCSRAILSVPRDRDQGEIDEEGCGRYEPWPVCSRPEGSHPGGLCDLIGNVEEMTEDEYCPGSAPVGDGSPARCGGINYVLRGGHWHQRPDEVSAVARSATEGNSPIVAPRQLGFRVARSLPPSGE